MMSQRDYYTIEEAASQVGCSVDDIYHWISTKRIEAVLYTNQRQFMATSWNEESQIWEGNGTVDYRGLLSVDSSWITLLLDHDEVILITQAIPLEPNDYSNYSLQCPFQEETLPEDISIWEPYELDDIIEAIQLCPIPTQTRNRFSLLSDSVINTFSSIGLIDTNDSKTKEYKSNIDIPKYDFNYALNGKYTLDDLRLTNFVVERLVQLTKGDKSWTIGNTKTGEADLKQLPWCESKSKFREIDAVIERLFRDQGNKQCKILWRALEKDINSELSRYDIHDIVTIGLDSLDWKNLSGKLSQLKYKTFCDKISAIRGFYSLKDLIVS